MAWFHPIGIVKSSRRHKLRSEASRPLREGHATPRSSTWPCAGSPTCSARPSRTARRSPPARCPERPPVRVRTARVARLLGTDLGAGAHRRAARPDRLHHHAGRRRPRRRHPVVALRLRDRDRRHRGGRPPPRLLGPRSHAAQAPRPPAGCRRGRRSDAGSGPLLVGRGLTEAMPMPFLAPGELARCGLPDDGITIANPLVAEQSVLRTSLLPGPGRRGRLQLVAPQPRRAPVRDRSHVQPPVDRPTPTCPTSARRSAPCWPARDATEAVHLWRFVAEALGVDRRARSRTARCPGFHPTRSARILVRRRSWSGALGEIDPGVLEAHGIGERVAYLEVDLDALLDAAARRPHLPALQPVPEQRHRPRLRGRRRRARVRRRGRHPRRRRRAPLERPPLRRLPRRGRGRRPSQPRLHPALPGPRPHPHRRRRRRRSARRSSRPSSPPSAPPSAADLRRRFCVRSAPDTGGRAHRAVGSRSTRWMSPNSCQR